MLCRLVYEMGSRACFVLVVLFFTATLTVTVYLRGSNHRVFYTLQRCRIEQGRLRQELRQKQLRVESLINPASISQRLDEQNAMGGPQPQTRRKANSR
jgi:hypothetical protein